MATKETLTPCEIKLHEPNETTYAAMEAGETGKDMYGPFESVAELMDALNDYTDSNENKIPL